MYALVSSAAIIKVYDDVAVFSKRCLQQPTGLRHTCSIHIYVHSVIITTGIKQCNWVFGLSRVLISDVLRMAYS